MPGQNFIDEYLVGLGFHIDSIGYARFVGALREASGIVDRNYLSMAKSVLGFETAAVGAFGALGSAVIGLADKTAMADQDYRLLALHMYTSLPVARELKVALDALGQPLENVVWDPELQARFQQLIKDQQTMTKELGPQFENQMLRIRDVRFEFTRFGVELKYLSMLVVEDLAKAFGTSMDGLLDKMRSFNDYLIRNLPGIAQWLTDTARPVLGSIMQIFSDLKDDAIIFMNTFTHVMGLLTGDKDLQRSTGGWKDFAKAVQEAALALAGIVDSILRIGGNIGLLFDAGAKAAQGDYKGALKSLGQMKTVVPEGPPSLGPAAGLGTGAGPAFWTKANIQAVIRSKAQAFGIDPLLALAVGQQESGFKQYGAGGGVLTSDKGALGIMQVMPQTAQAFGLDPRDPGQNIEAGIRTLKERLEANKGNVDLALRQYNAGMAPHAFLSGQAGKYSKDVQSIEMGMKIQSLTINVNGTNMSGDQVKRAVNEGLTEFDRARVMRNLNELAFPAWSPG